jgi:hypothetical protein
MYLYYDYYVNFEWCRIGVSEDGKKVWAKGTVTKVYVDANRFWVQVGGKSVWFRVDFHVDLVKWALMEGKVLRVESVQEHCDHHFVVHLFRGLGS